MEEEGCLFGSKTSIINELGESDTDQLYQISTLAPRSNKWSETGSNALSSEGDNIEIIAENDTNLTESVTDFSNSNLKDIEGAKGNSDPAYHRSPYPARRRRVALQSTGAEETLVTAAATLRQFKESALSELPPPRSSEVGKQGSSTGEKLNRGLFKSSSLPYARSQSLPVDQSSSSRRLEDIDMTKSHHKPLTRTASVSSLDNMADEEERTDEDGEWTNKNSQASGANLKQSVTESSSDKQRARKTEASNTRLQRSLPAHIQREICERAQKASRRPQSPLVLHQLKSPQRTPASHRVATSPKQSSVDSTSKSPSLKKKDLHYTRSVSEPVKESRDKMATQPQKENSNTQSLVARKPVISSEKYSSSNSKLVTEQAYANWHSHCKSLSL